MTSPPLGPVLDVGGAGHEARTPSRTGSAYDCSTHPGKGYADAVSGEREELRRLVDELPEEQVRAALANLRQRSAPVGVSPGAPWPPAFFNSITADRDDMGRNHDDILAEGFGQDR